MSNAPTLGAETILKSTAVLVLAAVSAWAGPIGYAVNFGGQFGTIDLGTGAFTAIGGGTGNTTDGIGGAPGGPFYTVDATSGHLLRIGANGSVFDVGDTGTGPNVGPNGVSIVGSLTGGAMYALGFSNELYSINTGTGRCRYSSKSGFGKVLFNLLNNRWNSRNSSSSRLFLAKSRVFTKK